jgi:predicted transcriptional regulator of viral defense system
MNKIEVMDMLLEQNNGIIMTANITAAGISKPYFAEYVEKRDLERVSHGIYVSKDAWVDSMYLLQLRYAQAIFSHETALFLHDLTDREPIQYAVTVKTGYNTSKLLDANAKVYTIRKDLYELGATEATTSFGHSIIVYDKERTVCDIVRSRSRVEIQTFQDALKQYSRSKDKNLRLLMEYAGKFHIERILNQYMEVLLP